MNIHVTTAATKNELKFFLTGNYILVAILLLVLL